MSILSGFQGFKVSGYWVAAASYGPWNATPAVFKLTLHHLHCTGSVVWNCIKMETSGCDLKLGRKHRWQVCGGGGSLRIWCTGMFFSLVDRNVLTFILDLEFRKFEWILWLEFWKLIFKRKINLFLFAKNLKIQPDLKKNIFIAIIPTTITIKYHIKNFLRSIITGVCPFCLLAHCLFVFSFLRWATSHHSPAQVIHTLILQLQFSKSLFVCLFVC